MKNTLLLIFAFLLSEFYNVAVSQDFAFYNINNLSGISMREVTAVVRDDDGFVWAASRTGVLRVATDDYQLYSLPFTTTDVMQIKMACRGGLLVVATQNGQIFRYNRVLDKFDLWFTFSSLLGNEDWVTNLLIDVDGKVWISTSTGIFLWTGEEIVRAFDNIAGISNMTLLEGCYALAFVQSSIYRINTRNRTKTKLQGHLPYIISSARYDAHTHRVWIGTYNAGLWQYDLIGQMLRKAAIPQFPKLIVRDILIPDTTSLWVGVDGGGIWILDSETCQVRQVLRENLDNPSSLRGNSVYSLLVDDHRVWTATNSGGLQYTEITRSNVEHLVHGINNPQSLHNNEVNHIVTDSRGNLWIATNDGISLREAYTHRWKQLYRGCQQVFLSLATDKKGRIYAGTYGEGLYVLDETTGRKLHHYTSRDGNIFGAGGFVFATYVDSEGKKVRPVMLHRVIYGSIERFIGILIEHYGGHFPMWLAPKQIEIIPVLAEKHGAYAHEVCEALKAKGIRCSVDERNEKLGYRVREAQIAKIPAQIVVGEGECEERTVTIRRSGQKQSVTLPLQEAIDAFVQEIEEKRA